MTDGTLTYSVSKFLGYVPSVTSICHFDHFDLSLRPLKTPLPRQFTFLHADKLREVARKGEALATLEQKQALEHAIEMGRGGIYLRLTPSQYARLTRP